MSQFYNVLPPLPNLTQHVPTKRKQDISLNMLSTTYRPPNYGRYTTHLPSNLIRRNDYSASPKNVCMIDSYADPYAFCSTMNYTPNSFFYGYDGSHTMTNYTTFHHYASNESHFVHQQSSYAYNPNINTHSSPIMFNSRRDNETSITATQNHSTPIAMERTPTQPIVTPQNLKKDPHRSAKINSELCLYYSKNKKCPFGSNCNYAHGEDELKYKKLLDMEKAGLIVDACCYRTRPCWTWIATGAW